MRVTGLDLSLTSTGVAHWSWVPEWHSPRKVVLSVQFSKFKPGLEHVRLQYLLRAISEQSAGSDLVVLEGPSYGSPNKQHALGGLWWLVAHGLWKRGQPYVVVTPQQRAKYITGKAGAGKVEVAIAAVRRYPAALLTNDDEADALVLVAMVADYLGLPHVVPVPKAQREVLEHITWPAAFQDAREALNAG